MQNYHASLKTFPPGGIVGINFSGGMAGIGGIYASVHTMLFPYFEDNSMRNIYDQNAPWYYQKYYPATATTPLIDVPGTVINVMVCPSSGGDNPVVDQLLSSILMGAYGATNINGNPIPGNMYQDFGITNYSFCKGVTDAWCVGANGVPPTAPLWVPISERGMFDLDLATNVRKITDGLSKTIAVGDASSNSTWVLTAAAPPGGGGMPTNFTTPASPTRIAYQAWIASEPAPLSIAITGMGLRVGCTMNCTLDPMNKRPVTDAAVDISIPAHVTGVAITGTTMTGGCKKSRIGAAGHPGHQLLWRI